MSDVSAAIAAGEDFSSLGQTWTLSHVGPAVRAAASRWCKRQAYAELEESRQCLPAEAWRQKAARLDREMASGSYNWGSPYEPDRAGEGLARLTQTDEGHLAVVGLLLASAHPTLTPAKVKEVVEGADQELFAGAYLRALGLAPNAGGAERPPPKSEPGAGPAAAASPMPT